MVVEAEQDPAKANPLEYAIKARRFIREKAGL
jgi:inosose dehydratase